MTRYKRCDGGGRRGSWEERSRSGTGTVGGGTGGGADRRARATETGGGVRGPYGTLAWGSRDGLSSGARGSRRCRVAQVPGSRTGRGHQLHLRGGGPRSYPWEPPAREHVSRLSPNPSLSEPSPFFPAFPPRPAPGRYRVTAHLRPHASELGLRSPRRPLWDTTLARVATGGAVRAPGGARWLSSHPIPHPLDMTPSEAALPAVLAESDGRGGHLVPRHGSAPPRFASASFCDCV